MEKIRLKVCGQRDNIAEVAALQPDYLGFIFYRKTPRYVNRDFQMPKLNPEIKKVGVFVNETKEDVLKIASCFALDLVQLHGTESVDFCKEIVSEGLRVIKAFPVENELDQSLMEQYESTVDYFLFDTKTVQHGGSGRAFNWKVLEDYKLKPEYFLAGGISLDNIQELKEQDLSKLHALDVNSQFEIKPGLKDVERIEKLKKQISQLELNVNSPMEKRDGGIENVV